MIPDFIRDLFQLKYDYGDVVYEQRAQRLLYIVAILLFASLFGLFIIAIPSMNRGDFVGAEASLISLATGLILYRLIQRGYAVWASYVLVAFLLLVDVPIQAELVNSPAIANAIVPIVMAGVFLSRREILFVTAFIILNIVRVIILGGAQLEEMGLVLVSMFASGLFMGLFNNSLEKITRSSSKLIVQTQHLTEHKDVSDSDTTPEQIIANAINLFRSQLGFNYIRAALLDEDHKPIVTYYSSIGVEQVAETTAFSFTSNSAFQQAINTKQPIMMAQQDSDNISAHLLPSSSVGVVIPAQSFNQVVALFDIQSESPEPIAQETITLLDLFLSQLASNLVYYRTVTTLRDDIREQQATVNQQRQQLLNIQRRQTEGIVTDWQYYLQQRGLDAIGYDIDDKRQISDINMDDLSDELRLAFEKGEVLVQERGDQQEVIIPIRFRETTLGAMSFTVPIQIPMTERKLEFIRSVTERLALALDNKRLLEQTQTQAERESTANEIGSNLLRSTDIQTVLQTAADSFNEALGAISTQIYLQPVTLESNENQQVEDAV